MKMKRNNGEDAKYRGGEGLSPPEDRLAVSWPAVFLMGSAVGCRLPAGDVRGYDCIMAAFANQPDDPAAGLLRLGDRLGYLSYQMINDRLPDEIASPEMLEALLVAIEKRGIRLIDEADPE